jgi:hypothetical protein
VSIRDDRGGVAGLIRIKAPRGFERPVMAGQTILVDGRAATRTENDGSFFVGGLRPGVYRIELESAMLPIELTPLRRVVVAEVAPAAVTRVDFLVRPEFGIAGRVTDSRGTPVPGIRVELIGADGERAAVATTDAFGLFRVDGLPIGRYELRPVEEDLGGAVSPTPRREIEIRDDFLFGQDLQLPVVVAAPPRLDEISRRRDAGPDRPPRG